jgi:hypothetical protein
MDSIPLINGKAYEYADIIVSILGVPTPSVSSISYTEEQESKLNFGTGNRAVSYGSGTINGKGDIEISMNDSEAIRDVAPSGSFLKLPLFDIVIVFGNPQKLVTHTIKNVKFTNDGVSGTTGDTDMKMKFSFITPEIRYR